MPPLPTRDLVGIPIMAVGGPVRGIGSPPEGDFFTEDDLRAVAKDTTAVIDEIRPFNKIGHSSAQVLARRSGFYSDDDQPQTGRLMNLRVAGGKLLADLKGVPAKLADLIESGAFPERSVEIKPYESQAGKGRYEKVIRALSWQGAKAPAIKTLDDVVALYGDDEIEDDPELLIATLREEGEPPALDLRIELVPGERKMEADGDTRGVADGTDKTPALALDDEQAKTLAETLGIEGDLTFDALVERAAEIKKLGERREAEGEGDEGEGEGDGSGSDSGEGDGAGDEAAGRMLSEADYNDLLARANAGADAARKLAEKERDDEIEAAIAAGKFDPAQRDEFVRLYEESPDLMTRVISALPENEERAKIYGTEDEREFSEEDDAFYRRYLALAAIEPGEAA